ncbi:hypothetical protein FHY11_000885 [Xanthomonas arboricola]|uniref:hypothetical protein n=1 Tax=Xanthomonas euroxanthea TaxID=2259622 RepID=UPI00141A8B47|nr:hypothetical protein [Xanthomonas euroxanthea]NIK07419.1 hypothetical protein [Xanthomonas euroxanthea]
MRFAIGQSANMNFDPRTIAVVDHFDDDREPVVLETLDQPWFGYIERFLQKSALGTAEDTLVVHKLQELASQKRWLICGCQGAHSAKSPVFFPKQVPKGTIRKATLVHLYDRPAHHPDCKLSRERPLSLGGISGLPRVKKVKGLAVLKAMERVVADAASYAHQPAEPTSRAQAMPTLARVLFTILEGASLHRMAFEKKAIEDQMKALSSYLDGRFLDAAKAAPARPWFKLSWSHLDELKAKIVAKQEDFGKVQPQGFVIDVVDDHDTTHGEHVLTRGKQTYSFKGRLLIPGEGTEGPWLAIALVALLPGQSSPQICQVYLHPLNKLGSYVLVDSGLERQTLGLLEKMLFKFNGMKKPFEIIKPLIDLKLDGQGVRPDFILEARGKRLIVETMGFKDEEYLEQKERMHELMRKLPGVVDLFAHDGSNDRELKDFVNQLA